MLTTFWGEIMLIAIVIWVFCGITTYINKYSLFKDQNIFLRLFLWPILFASLGTLYAIYLMWQSLSEADYYVG